MFAPIATTRAEDRPEASLQDAGREWYELANKRVEFEVSDPALLPRLLVIAAEQAGCDYKTDIKSTPVRFIVVQQRRFAIVVCSGRIHSDQFVFDLTDLRRPKLIEFPVMAYEGGFGTTRSPGAVTWKKELGVFEAETSSDMGCTGRGRYTYRLSRTELSFALIRVEIKKDECRQLEWTTIWEAPTWSELIR